MSLQREVLHRSDELEIRRVDCRPETHGPGAEEHELRPTLVFPTGGVFRLHLGRRDTLVVDATQALLLPAGRPHRYSHPAGTGDRSLAIALAPQALAGMLDTLDPAAADRGAVPYAARLLPATPILALRARFERRLRAGRAGELEVEETVVELLAALVESRRGALAGRATSPAPGRAQVERVEAVQLRLASDPGRSWRLGELGRLVAVSPCHLTTLFRRVTGVPIHRYLLRLRLARALEEVLDGGRELTAIGLDLGFATPSHFTASFRHAFGQSPSSLRRAGRQP